MARPYDDGAVARYGADCRPTRGCRLREIVTVCRREKACRCRVFVRGDSNVIAAGRAKEVGFPAAFPISPAAQTWERTVEIQARVKRAVREITIPVLLVMPPKDASLEPARV